MTQKLLSIINDILDLTKVESGHFDLQYTPIELDPLLEELKQMFDQKISSAAAALAVVIHIVQIQAQRFSEIEFSSKIFEFIKKVT